MSSDNNSIKKHFLISGHLEGISFLVLLLIAMPLKYFANMPIAVTVVGMLHGILFIYYIYQIYNVYDKVKWPIRKCIISVFLGVVPFGTFALGKLWD